MSTKKEDIETEIVEKLRMLIKKFGVDSKTITEKFNSLLGDEKILKHFKIEDMSKATNEQFKDIYAFAYNRTMPLIKMLSDNPPVTKIGYVINVGGMRHKKASKGISKVGNPYDVAEAFNQSVRMFIQMDDEFKLMFLNVGGGMSRTEIEKITGKFPPLTLVEFTGTEKNGRVFLNQTTEVNPITDDDMVKQFDDLELSESLLGIYTSINFDDFVLSREKDWTDFYAFRGTVNRIFNPQQAWGNAGMIQNCKCTNEQSMMSDKIHEITIQIPVHDIRELNIKEGTDIIAVGLTSKYFYEKEQTDVYQMKDVQLVVKDDTFGDMSDMDLGDNDGFEGHFNTDGL